MGIYMINRAIVLCNQYCYYTSSTSALKMNNITLIFDESQIACFAVSFGLLIKRPNLLLSQKKGEHQASEA